MGINVPRDRNGDYKPKIIAKYDRNADGMEEKILGLYACGMCQRDIAEQIKSLYDVEMSPALVSKISEKIMPEVIAWQNRPPESVYPFVFMDAIHYKIIDKVPKPPTWCWAFAWMAGRIFGVFGSAKMRAVSSGSRCSTT